jgi:hypothetical protein
MDLVILDELGYLPFPPGLVVDRIEMGAGLTITARPKAAAARCPRYDGISSRSGLRASSRVR